MGLGLSIFLEWFGAALVGILLGLLYYYIFEKDDEDSDDRENNEDDQKLYEIKDMADV